MSRKTLTLGALIGLLVCGALGSVAAAAAPPPPPTPYEVWGRPEDPELAQITADIFLLRQINEAGLTRDQIKKLIPVLEGILGDAERLRGEVKAKLLAQRKLLLEGKQTAESAEAAKRQVQESAKRFADEARKSLERTRSFLSPAQVERLTHLLTTRPGRFSGRADGEHRADRRPGMREAERDRERGPAIGPRPGLGGPSTVVMRRVISLLKEKLRAM